MNPVTIAVVCEPPAGLDALIEEALGNGVHFMSGLREEIGRRGWLFETGEAMFAARSRDSLAAVAVIMADPYVEDRDVGRLRWIYVREAFRQRGLARELVRACLEHAGQRWRRIRLHTDNPIAAGLYLQFGFQPTADGGRATHQLDL